MIFLQTNWRYFLSFDEKMSEISIHLSENDVVFGFEYQLIINGMEPKGQGALQLAFEQLKGKLADEGLFEDRHKDKIPFLPNKIGVITSQSGAAGDQTERG